MVEQIQNTLVFCKDAGGAEIIASYIVSKKIQNKVLLFGEGPAKKIFLKYRLIFLEFDENIIIEKFKSKSIRETIVGTGLSGIEIRLIKNAKEYKIKSIAYIDSWVNYKERFGYPSKNWQENLPNEIWVGDIGALGIAKKNFPHSVKILYKKNQYFDIVKNKVESHRNKKKHILLLSKASGFIKEEILTIMASLKMYKNKQPVTIRLHPADSGFWLKWISNEYKFKLSSNSDYWKDLCSTNLAIGNPTVALYTSAISGINSYVINFKDDNFLNIPAHKKIQKIGNINTLNNFLIKLP